MTGGGIEELYPFLYEQSVELTPVLEQVTASTIEKVQETAALRVVMAQRYAERLAACATALAASLAGGATLYSFGNGGSSSDAAAVASTFDHPPWGRPLPAVCLTADVCALTALANDVGYEVVFARQLAAWGKANDIALGLSTSGGSANVLRAFDEAHRRGMITVGFAGYDGGALAQADTVDYLFIVPSASVHRIQETQTTTYHVLWELTQQALR